MPGGLLGREGVVRYGRFCAPAPPGNNPWPIGVTSVGIHERSAREKISHVMNGGAHIMNDEATRKYLQARFFRASRESV